ncbi:MAG TPA: single-stranded-DNA-specific exonuclease RecJ [Chitinophagaceae bacterium]|nr:single-stranded-DNA-specific exonuclease RecJ [Chitinophagaceae bacterium]
MALQQLNKRWTLKPAPKEVAAHLHQALNIHPVLCRLLSLRGIDTYAAAKQFFRPDMNDLHDPFLMKGMAQAADRICEAVEWNERILVYGDYDVDGTTAVAVMYSFLRDHYTGVLSFYIPHRYREGYGISKAGVDFAIANGYTLMITLDCGIKSVELIAYAKSHGIDVIICDHHTPDQVLPPAFAILNPKQPDCPYPFKELSGCGIGYKLICALAGKWQLPAERTTRFLDLVATSIAADIVPVDGENRVLAYFGIKKANENPCLSIETLKNISGLVRDITLTDLVFAIGPKINAAGRMDDARKAVDLFIEKDPEKIKELAAVLMTDNTDRKEVDKNITEEALSLLENDTMLGSKKSTVLYKEHWHKGVVGIVASRLIDYCYKPTIVLAMSNGKVSGSARSVIGFNVYEAIYECRELLENYGGHFYAAGITMKPENYLPFVRKFEEVVSGTIDPRLLVPEIEIDAEIELEDIKPAFYNIIRQFEPFGPNNMRPVFCTRNVYDYQGNSRIVKEQHIKFVITNRRGIVIDGIGFKMADKFPYTHPGPFDIVYTLDENEFNGSTKLQIKVLDIRPSY